MHQETENETIKIFNKIPVEKIMSTASKQLGFTPIWDLDLNSSGNYVADTKKYVTKIIDTTVLYYFLKSARKAGREAGEDKFSAVSNMDALRCFNVNNMPMLSGNNHVPGNILSPFRVDTPVFGTVCIYKNNKIYHVRRLEEDERRIWKAYADEMFFVLMKMYNLWQEQKLFMKAVLPLKVLNIASGYHAEDIEDMLNHMSMEVSKACQLISSFNIKAKFGIRHGHLYCLLYVIGKNNMTADIGLYHFDKEEDIILGFIKKWTKGR